MYGLGVLLIMALLVAAIMEIATEGVQRIFGMWRD